MKKISQLNGCQTFWTSFQNIPHCWNETKILSFVNIFWKYYEMEKNDLTHHSGCFEPCEYMEYKVTFLEWSLLIDIWYKIIKYKARRKSNKSWSPNSTSLLFLHQPSYQCREGRVDNVLHVAHGGLLWDPGGLYWI